MAPDVRSTETSSAPSVLSQAPATLAGVHADGAGSGIARNENDRRMANLPVPGTGLPRPVRRAGRGGSYNGSAPSGLPASRARRGPVRTG